MKYIKLFSLYVFLLLASIGLFNWFIDPFAMYWSPQIEGINQKKPQASNRIRVTKPFRVAQTKPEILIMGNSRTELGISPHNDIFAGKRVYNLSLAGATFHSQIDHIYHAMHQNDDLSTIIFGLDFFDFLVTEFGNETDNQETSYGHRIYSAKGWQDKKAYYLELLSLFYSLDTLKSSIATLAQQGTEIDSIDSLGFNNAHSYHKIMRAEGKIPLFKQKLAFVDNKLSQKAWRIDSKDGETISPKFDKLLQLMRVSKTKGIALKLFINPYHYTYLHKISEQGYFDLYLTWKRKLTTFIDSQDQQNVTLIDFSGFNKFTLESENFNNPFDSMKWYWEPAHYKKQLGDIILDSIYNSSTSVFGTKLSTNNIDSIITQEQLDLNDSLVLWRNVNDNL